MTAVHADADSSRVALGATQSQAPQLHFQGTGPWTIAPAPSSYGLCLVQGGTCSSASIFDEDDTVGVGGPGIENIVGYFKVKSSIR